MTSSPNSPRYNIRADWARTLPTLRKALTDAREFFAAEPAARSVEATVIRADGRVTLTHIGRKGGHRILRTLGAVA